MKPSKQSAIKLFYETEQDYSTFIEVDKNKNTLTDTELVNVINAYPVLNDTIEVEIRKPVEYEDGSIYYGEWQKGTNLRHGRGIQIWEDGTRYQGYFMNNKANMKGKLLHSDGDIYEGGWYNGKAEGFGIYKHVDGSVYKGKWKQDKQHGDGQEYWPDGSYYRGEYYLGKKEGHGIFNWGDGSVYEGNFEDNLISGKGMFYYSY